jgi:hypothetical protein
MKWIDKMYMGVSVVLLAMMLTPMDGRAEPAMSSAKDRKAILGFIQTVSDNSNYLTVKNLGSYQIAMYALYKKTAPENSTGLITADSEQLALITKGRAKIDINGNETEAQGGDLFRVKVNDQYKLTNIDTKHAVNFVIISPNQTWSDGAVFKTKADLLKRSS